MRVIGAVHGKVDTKGVIGAVHGPVDTTGVVGAVHKAVDTKGVVGAVHGRKATLIGDALRTLKGVIRDVVRLHTPI